MGRRGGGSERKLARKHKLFALVNVQMALGQTDGCHRVSRAKKFTILTEMMADEFNFLRPEVKNHKAEADADFTPIPGQLELRDRCRCGVLLSTCFCALNLLQI